jgi:hypothetical protein
MKKVRLQSFEKFVGIIPENELIVLGFAQIDDGIHRANKILNENGISVEYPDVLILNDKEYPRPPK